MSNGTNIKYDFGAVSRVQQVDMYVLRSSKHTYLPLFVDRLN